jgi:hypothetical protein
VPTFTKNLLNATSAGAGGITHFLKFGGISSFVAPKAGGKSAGVGKFDQSTANITTFPKDFKGVSAYKIPGTVTYGAVSSGVGGISQQHSYPAKLVGAVSAGVGVVTLGSVRQRTFTAVESSVGGVTKTSVTASKSFGGKSAGVGGVVYFSTAPQKLFGGISAFAFDTRPRSFRAVSAGFGGVNQTHGTFATYQKTFGSVSAYLRPTPFTRGISSGVGGFQKTFTGPIQKTFGVVGRGRGGFPGKVPRSFGAKSALTASWIDLIPGAYGSGAYGAGPYGGGQFIVAVRGISAHGVGGFTVSSASRRIGGVSSASGGISFGRSRKPGAVSPGIGAVSKTVLVSKSFGSVAPGIGQVNKVESVARNMGAVGSGVAGYQVATFRTFTLLVGGIGSGVGHTTFNGALAIHGFGAKAGIHADWPRPTRVAVKVIYGVSRAKGGTPTPINKTFGAIVVHHPYFFPYGAIGYMVVFGATSHAKIELDKFVPVAQRIKDTGTIIKQSQRGKILVF